MALYGIDISNYQSDSEVNNAEDFVICKATEGVGWTDITCDSKYQKARSLGKARGFYHFARPDYNSPEAEAEWFVHETENYFHHAIPALDWEQPGTQSNVQWAKRWLDRVYQLTGVRPLIYMSASVVNAYNWSSVSKDYGLWLAGYPSEFEVPNPRKATPDDFPYSIGDWEFVVMWQYSSSAGILDKNIFFGDINTWNKYACRITETKKEEKKEEPKPAPEPAEEPKEEKKEEEPSMDEKPQESQNTGQKGGNTDEHLLVPEQPESTDTGLTKEQWDDFLGKAQKTIDLAEDTAKKFGLTITMNSKVYDVLKTLAIVVLPVISLLYVGLANIWGFGFGEQVDATVQLVINAINAILGITVLKSSSDYHKGENK